jgi:hypothetical protein
MRRAGFHRDVHATQPGAWLNPAGIPVDLMVPEALAGQYGRRAARIPPHANDAARRAAGLEAAVVDHSPVEVRSLAEDDHRCHTANVAGPAALLIAKLFKLGERQATPGRLVDKDAHDIYRLLLAVPTDRLAVTLLRLRKDELAGGVTMRAMDYLRELFAAGAAAPGSVMAGRAEEGIGEPSTASAAVAALAADLLAAVDRQCERPQAGDVDRNLGTPTAW